MKTEIIAVGTELLMGHVVNTNAAEIAETLGTIGIGVHYQSVVGDNSERLADVVRTARERAELVVICGGLGPTDDDLTRETVAAVCGLPLRRDDAWADHLTRLFAERRWGPGRNHPLPENNMRQAMVPEGGELLPNDRGTAPGIYLEHDGTTFVLLPGPPREMRGLLAAQVVPRLHARNTTDGSTGVLVSRVLRIIGVGESRLVELIEPVLATQTNPTVAPLAQVGEVHLRITAHAATTDEAQALIDPVARRVYESVGTAIYGEDDETLERAVGALLATAGRTIATAESCTGGLVSHRLTNVPGSSRYLVGGVVAYSDAVKRSLLEVDQDLIARDGAVSEAVARGMARGVATRLGSDIGVGITGIAGPDGGSADKPVGLTWIAVAAGDEVICHQFSFPGERAAVKERAANSALAMVRELLIR